jgi:hypothetical protein
MEKESLTKFEFQHIEDYLPKIKELYDEDRILEAIELVKEIGKYFLM